MRRRRVRAFAPRMNRHGRLIGILLLFLLLSTLVTLRIRPIMLQYASNIVQYTATQAIDNAMEDRIYKHRAEYQGLVVLDRDNDNRVTALKTDTIAINRIKTETVDTLYKALNSLESTVLKIPVGTIFAPHYCSGLGPPVKIGMAGMGFASAEFISAFTQAGINQTRHRLILEVRADVSVLTPLGSKTTTVTSRFNVTDTVIVGTVPEQYTYIDDTRQGLLGKINDYTKPTPKILK